MPINEENVIITLTEIETEIDKLRERKAKIYDLHKKAESIQLVVTEITVPTVAEVLAKDGSVEKPAVPEYKTNQTSKPIDEKLGVVMADDRREAIYEKVLVDLAAL